MRFNSLTSAAIVAITMATLPSDSVFHSPPATFYSVGSADDPQARATFEFMRLRDPRTGVIPRGIRAKEVTFSKTIASRKEAAGRLKKQNRWLGEVESWQPRGPYNVGGRTRALAIDVNDESRIIAGGVSGGLWKSTNAGATWVKTTRPDQLHSVTCVAQDPRPGRTHIWYAGSGEVVGNTAKPFSVNFKDVGNYRGDGLYKSTDNGDSWFALESTRTHTPQSLDQMFDFCWSIAIDPSNLVEDVVYVSVWGGLVKSTDAGQSWEVVLGEFAQNGSGFGDVACTSTGVVYATLGKAVNGQSVKDQGFWRSDDGSFWVNITPAGFSTKFRRIVIGIAPSNENVVYFLANTTTSNSDTFYKYLADTQTWIDRSDFIPAAQFNPQFSFNLLVAVKPDDENFVMIGSNNLFRSSDGLASDENVELIGGYLDAGPHGYYPGHHPDQHAICYLPSNPDIVISAHDGGVSRTTDIQATEVKWESLSNGYTTTQFYTIAIDPVTAGSSYLLGGLQDNGTWLSTSTDPAAAWIQLFSGDGSFCAMSPRHENYYISAQQGLTYRYVLDSDHNTRKWARVDPAKASYYQFINAFVLDPNDYKKMYMPSGGFIWRNKDLTELPLHRDQPPAWNWRKLYKTQVLAEISALDVSKSPENVLYYGTINGLIYRVPDASDIESEPVNIYSDKGLPELGWITCLAVDPRDADGVMVVFSNYHIPSLFYSDNGGESWTDVSGNLEENPDGSGSGPSVRWATIMPFEQGEMWFVGTTTGLYSTTRLEGAATQWVQEGADEIGNVVVDMVRTRAVDRFVAVATHGNGVYTGYVRGGDIVVNPVHSEPDKITLEKNYPNPFNPTTQIDYSVKREGRVTLRIYNVQGQLVRTLTDHSHGPGHYTVTWDGTDQRNRPSASGVYIYRLSTDNSAQSARMILLR